ncbi:MAG: hypothetical protein D3904_13025 [Candidatus Electrothrix sp. EH2]|nr:hypothetical protein [Candidatus Electrothrix sp. EH2]
MHVTESCSACYKDAGRDACCAFPAYMIRLRGSDCFVNSFIAGIIPLAALTAPFTMHHGPASCRKTVAKACRTV